MEAFENRQFLREYEERDLSLQDLSDLLWAAYGINRDNGKRTAPTAQNSQDVNVYVCKVEGNYLYDAANNQLIPVTTADMSRYGGYDATSSDKNKHFYEMGAVDCGIVSQNIGLFCAGVGLATGPRAGMNQEGIRAALKLKDSEIIWLNHPVGYPKLE